LQPNEQTPISQPVPRDWRWQPDRRGRQIAQHVRQTVRALRLWQPGDRVLLGCSGGPDSLAALLLIDHLRRSLGHHLSVALVDHGLQPGRELAVALVQEACKARDLPLHVVHVQVQAGPQLEARCRDLRYAALAKLQNQLDCKVIVTAHHADDQAETLLMRACRGAGPEALTGIRSYRGDGVVRPLLGLSRADLLAVLGDRPAWRDPSNADEAHLRNRLRAQVMPLLEQAVPGASAGLSRTAAHLSHLDSAAQWWLAQALFQAHLLLEPGDLQGPLQPSAWVDGALVLPRALLPDHPAALAPIMRWICQRLAVAMPSDAAVAQVAVAALGPGPLTTAIAGLQFTRDRDHWHIRRTP
jgi:tRNA(Ile)-lysidine synthetase-like protein